MASAIRFGRAAAVSSLARTTGLPPVTGFTIMAWTKISVDKNDYAAMITYGATSASAYYALQTNDTGTRLDLWNGATEVTGTDLVTGIWNHLTMTVSGTSGNNSFAYLNGVLDITNASRSITGTQLTLGNNPTDNNYFNGCLAAVKMWGRVLTAPEILAEMPYVLPVNPEGLIDFVPVLNEWDRLQSGIYVPRLNGSTNRFGCFTDIPWTETGTIDIEPGPPIG
jgi:hypothetical protein